MLSSCWEYTTRQGSGFGWAVGKLADESGWRAFEVGPSVVIGDVPPWLLPDPVVDLTLVDKRKRLGQKSVIKGNWLTITLVEVVMLFYLFSQMDPRAQIVGPQEQVFTFLNVMCRYVED